MKTESGMDGAVTRLGLAGAVARGFAVVTALRWRALFLAVVLLPAVAWGEQTAREVLKEQRDHRLWKEVGRCDGAERYLKAFPEGLHADEARECPTERRAEEIELPDGLTLADWALMAEDRLEAGDHARLMEEAGAHLREYGPFESVEAIREQAVSGLMAEIRVTTREDAPGALERIARIEAAAGERPELLRLRARAHGLLDDHAAAEAAYLRWLRAVPQSHPERRDVLAALTRVRAEREMREKTRRFSERLGRPFSAEWKEDSVGWTDLHYAALLDLPEVVEALCEAGMDADTGLKSDSSFGDELKRTLVALGHEEFKDRSDAIGETPLMIAAMGNARNAAEGLVACGAEMNARDDNDWTPLHWAAQKNSTDVAKLLLEHGADLGAISNREYSVPLLIAAYRNSLDVAKLLLDRGADVDAADRYEKTALHIAVQRNFPDLAKLLLDRGADVDAADRYEKTALHIAGERNFPDLAKLLLDRGADVNAITTDHGWTPLLLAAINNSLDVAKLLIDRGADVDAKDDSGAKPLYVAAQSSALDVAKLLIDRGADVDAKNDFGATPLYVAAEFNAASEFDALGVAKLLIDHGADVNATDNKGSTPLHLAAWNNPLDVAKLLIDRGADVNATADNDGGNTPLHLAAWNDSLDVAKLLLDHGAAVDAKRDGGWTPLHIAAQFNVVKASDVAVAKLLLDRGAEVDAKNDSGATPLYIAAQHDALDMAKLLLDRGADANATDNDGNTPLDVALEDGDSDMQALLRESGTMLTVSTVPPDALVRVSTTTGAAYRDGMRLVPGQYEVSVEAKDHEPFRQRLSVDGPTSYQISLCKLEMRYEQICEDKQVERVRTERKTTTEDIEEYETAEVSDYLDEKGHDYDRYEQRADSSRKVRNAMEGLLCRRAARKLRKRINDGHFRVEARGSKYMRSECARRGGRYVRDSLDEIDTDGDGNECDCDSLYYTFDECVASVTWECKVTKNVQVPYSVTEEVCRDEARSQRICPSQIVTRLQ